MGTKGPNVSPFTCLTIPKPRKLDLKANKINSLCFTHPPTGTENLLFPWESPCPSLVIPSHTGHHLHCKWDQGAEMVGKIMRKMKKRGKGKVWALLCDAVQCWDSPMSGQGQPRRRVENQWRHKPVWSGRTFKATSCKAIISVQPLFVPPVISQGQAGSRLEAGKRLPWATSWATSDMHQDLWPSSSYPTTMYMQETMLLV